MGTLKWCDRKRLDVRFEKKLSHQEAPDGVNYNKTYVEALPIFRNALIYLYTFKACEICVV